MPFLTIQKDTDSPQEYSLQCEFTHLTVRIFIYEERIGSFTAISTGIDSVRITDLTLLDSYKFNRVILKSIRRKLKELGFKQACFERQIGKKFVVRKYLL